MRKKTILLILITILFVYAIAKMYPAGCSKTVGKISYASFQMPPGYTINAVPAATFTTIVFFQNSNFSYYVSSKTLVVMLPSEYNAVVLNASYILDDLDGSTKYSIASRYFAQGYPMLPGPNDYIMFSKTVGSAFRYGGMNPFASMDTLLQQKVGQCQNYAKLWAAVGLVEGKTVTVYMLIPLDKRVGHVFVVYNGMVIENNGHVYLNTLAALGEWYSAIGPYSIVMLTLYPDGVHFSISHSEVTSPPIEMKRYYEYSVVVTATLNNRVTTYTVSKNPFSWIFEECRKTYSIESTSSRYIVYTVKFGRTVPIAIMGFSPVIMPFGSLDNLLVYYTVNGEMTTESFVFINDYTTLTYHVEVGDSFSGRVLMFISSTAYMASYSGVLT